MTARIVTPSLNAGRDLTVNFVTSGLHEASTHAVRIVESADSEGQTDVIDLSAEQMDRLVSYWLTFKAVEL